jgi:hypothetical protein
VNTTTRERITDKSFDAIVTRWNALRPYERRERHDACIADGHEWVEPAFSERSNPTYVCRRCLRYDTRD